MPVVLLYLLLAGGGADDGQALAATAPSYLTPERAAQHVAAAEIAGAVYDVDPNLLLSIAHHESNYRVDEITLEAGGKMSCGVMTPEPMTDVDLCHLIASDVLIGYMHGASHLRGWIDNRRCRGDVPCALTGYAGGGHLIDLCRTDDIRQCHTWEVFTGRARWIARERARHHDVI